ncbi:metal ABC transporter ATP-binding protein [Nocardioides marmoriginsengisoli]|uniref:Metal ABC transporter ATP-binding protein n=1 Tax=Nocardioides marmoriginsengisoli TaxID=661483 RepID=A0A3N0CPK2_9ACTN|nr:metal ABC transporter ATP-binding protein [Nocardioides marmoriginsengisoli]RNL64966.1 metal ABC transporter ATP-binding protein [Nocardioides marmoriginsengisoli]
MSSPDQRILELRGVAVALGGRPILRDLDLTVEAGDVVALLGANGSGKSTLVKSITGLLPLSAGSVRLFGQPIREFDQWPRLGYVPQRSTIAQGVPSTVAEVVSAGRLSRRRPFLPARAADRRAVREALETVGLADHAQHQVSTLSGGQQQRVLIARTLAGDPELLVLDEPNAGVDLISQQAIAVTLERSARAGATIVVVLHELGAFAPFIDRAVILREGRIAYDGPPEGAHPHDPHGADAGAHCTEDQVRLAPISGVLGEDL